jgi:SAM-dependent methyltransferase
MKTETLNGIALSEVVGGGDPKEIANGIVDLIRTNIGLKPSAAILDVGCGCGRIAAGVAEQVNTKATYTGIDIVPGLVEFARKHITSRYPNFKFYRRSQTNVAYDFLIKGDETGSISKISDVCPAGSIDLAIAISLFTHLDFDEAKAILVEIERALKSEGKGFLTFFILDDDVRKSISEGHSHFSFEHPSASRKAFIFKPDMPTHAVGYNKEVLQELLKASGLLMEKHIPGWWCGIAPRPSYQDVIIVRKASSLRIRSRFSSMFGRKSTK